jgi:hypothetical protein
MRALIVALVLACPAGVAFANDTALRAYAEGDFLAAASAAERGDRALAARALIAEAITAGGDVPALLVRAERNARAGLAANPTDLEARLQLALAIGLQGRRAPIAEAMRKGYARESRALIDAALAQAPREAWGHALDGAWHLEIYRRGGAVGARMFGASVPEGVAALERARALAPDDAAIAYQYAVVLLDLDARRYQAKIAGLLAAAAACTAHDAFESAIRAKAEAVAATLAARGPVAARAAAQF